MYLVIPLNLSKMVNRAHSLEAAREIAQVCIFLRVLVFLIGLICEGAWTPKIPAKMVGANQHLGVNSFFEGSLSLQVPF